MRAGKKGGVKMKKFQSLSDSRQLIDGQKGKDITASLREIELLKAQIKEINDLIAVLN